MPFTFAHPAILLPFRKHLSVTGLIIGCMSPDFEYFLRLRIYSNFSHTFIGVFLFCLPISIIVSILFHQIIREPLIENAPKSIYLRTSKYKKTNWINYLKNNKIKIIFSILLGAFSHILWDSFTHDDGFFVNQLDLIKSNITMQQKEIPIIKILQHFSTLIGFIYIFWIFYHLTKSNQTNHRTGYYYFISIVILTLCFVFSVIKINPNTLKIGNLIVATISCSFISVLITSLIFKNKKATLN